MATKPTSTAKPATKAATKAATKSSTSLAVKSSSSVTSIQAALQAQVAQLADRTMPATGNVIRVTQDKKFLLPDGTKSDGPLELVIVDFMTTHKYYPGKYDKDNIVPPACFAIGVNPKDMTPSKNSPEQQSDNCQTCPMNAFGSDGDGKACKNGRALAVLPPEADADTPMWVLNVSPTALKGFDGYVNAVARTYQLPPMSVITKVSFDDSVSHPKLLFSDPVPNPLLELAYSRQGEAQEMLRVEPDVSNYEKPAAKPGKRVGRR